MFLKCYLKKEKAKAIHNVLKIGVIDTCYGGPMVLTPDAESRRCGFVSQPLHFMII